MEKSTTQSVCRVKDITFPLGKVVFVKSIRQDIELNTTSPDKALSAIEVYSTFNGDKLVKKYQLNYSYFNSAFVPGTNAKSLARLKLTSLVEVDVNTGAFKPPYSFNYNESINFGTFQSIALSLPAKLSKGKDHWGYPNNKNSNYSTFGPTQEQVNVNGDVINFTGIDRNLDVNYLQAGILTKVTYPTGGFSEFTYEANDYYSPTDNQKEVGGLRVKQIRVSDGVNSAKDMYTEYKYVLTDAQNNFTTNSSGVLMQDIMYTRVPASTTAGWPVYRTETSILPVGSHTNGNIVGYSEVTVLTGQNGSLGKTTYKYNAFPNYHYEEFGTSTFGPAAYYEFVYNTIAQRSPSFSSETNTNKMYLYVFGLLKSSISFKKSGSNYIPVTEIENSYNEFDNSLLSNMTFSYNVILNGELTTNSTYCCNNQTPIYSCSGQSYENVCFLDEAEILTFKTPSLKLKQTSLREYLYDQVTLVKKNVKESTYEYANDNHYQLTKVCFNDINNPEENTCTEYTYPLDYTGSANVQEAITAMGDSTVYNYRHIHNAPIEIITLRKDAGVYKVIRSTINRYKYLVPYPGQYWLYPLVFDEARHLETNIPLTVTTQSSQHTWAGYFCRSKNMSYLPSLNFDNDYSTTPYRKFYLFDDKGNVTEERNEVGQSFSTIYGYNKTLPIAKVTNANRSQVAYSGFESGSTTGEEGWELSSCTMMDGDVTGNEQKVLAGRYSAMFTSAYGPTKNVTPSPQTGKYKLSCYIRTEGASGHVGWLIAYTVNAAVSYNGFPNIPEANRSVPIYHTNGQWQYHEVEIDLDYIRQSQGIPSSTVLTIRCFVNNGYSVPVYVDEMRIHPVDAEMETCSYIPLVGKSAVADQNSNITFTEYDGFQRIKLIRDHDGNILKRYNYVYKQ